ncbi:hypothetical protein D9758_007577 [Tetrapyrgos nigripes]|uniref:Uncharacterized protein n=1 Tax=Tetrapyrgos nigripes TaxID=182062 RepID=A0A8H5LJX3_9AGAR|nr:hypothetical protein D9758_007577 [Tetrapyrgos nigripes]
MLLAIARSKIRWEIDWRRTAGKNQTGGQEKWATQDRPTFGFTIADGRNLGRSRAAEPDLGLGKSGLLDLGIGRTIAIDWIDLTGSLSVPLQNAPLQTRAVQETPLSAMLDLPHPMFTSSTIIDDVDAKLNATHLFCHQQHSVQIIQLVEGPPPPRRVIDTNSYYSASSSDYSSDEEDEEDEEDCSSYCSSEDDAEVQTPPQQTISLDVSPSADTYSLRMKRILAWRENFSAHMSATLSEPCLSSSLKRKINVDHDDTMSHSSKRSRSESSSHSGVSSLGALSCPACDAFFDTRQDLRQHGREALAGANEACFTAVDYAFE